VTLYTLNKGTFVVVGDGNPMYSKDGGTTWTAGANNPGYGRLYDIVYAAGKFVAVGYAVP
jgi:hypothetical protein